MLAQEPWCFTPEELAGVTLWQAEHLYLRPAVERAEARRQAAGPESTPAAPAEDPFERGLPDREAFVAAHQRAHGRPAAHWNAIYDRLVAERAARPPG